MSKAKRAEYRRNKLRKILLEQELNNFPGRVTNAVIKKSPS